MGLIKFTCKNDGSLASVAASRIIYFADFGHYRNVYLDDGGCLPTEATLESLETAYIAASGKSVTSG